MTLTVVCQKMSDAFFGPLNAFVSAFQPDTLNGNNISKTLKRQVKYGDKKCECNVTLSICPGFFQLSDCVKNLSEIESIVFVEGYFRNINVTGFFFV